MRSSDPGGRLPCVRMQRLLATPARSYVDGAKKRNIDSALQQSSTSAMAHSFVALPRESNLPPMRRRRRSSNGALARTLCNILVGPGFMVICEELVSTATRSRTHLGRGGGAHPLPPARMRAARRTHAPPSIGCPGVEAMLEDIDEAEPVVDGASEAEVRAQVEQQETASAFRVARGLLDAWQPAQYTFSTAPALGSGCPQLLQCVGAALEPSSYEEEEEEKEFEWHARDLQGARVNHDAHMVPGVSMKRILVYRGVGAAILHHVLPAAGRPLRRGCGAASVLCATCPSRPASQDGELMESEEENEM